MAALRGVEAAELRMLAAGLVEARLAAPRRERRAVSAPRLLHMGGAVVDFVYRARALPLPGTEIVADAFTMLPGGGFNMMYAARRSGMDVAYGGPHGTGPHGDFIRAEIREKNLTAVHDLSDGGALAAIAEMAMAGGIGARLAPDTALPLHVWAFAEDQARYAVTLPESAAAAFLERAAKAGIPAARIGTTGGAELTLEGVKPISLKALKEAHEGWLPAYMAAGAEL